MKKSFTEEDILRFLYNELSIRESEAFLDALYSDEALWEKFESYQQAVDTLVPLDMEPSEESLQNVLDYISETHSTAPTSFPTLTSPVKPYHGIMMAVLVFTTSLVIAGSVYLVSQSSVGIAENIQQEQEAPSASFSDYLVPDYMATPIDQEDSTQFSPTPLK